MTTPSLETIVEDKHSIPHIATDEDILQKAREASHYNYALHIMVREYDRLKLEEDECQGLLPRQDRHNIADIMMFLRRMYFYSPSSYGVR